MRTSDTACRLLVVLILGTILVAPALRAAPWVPLGPEGGDVRSLAYDPQNPDRILLGTSAGQLYLSSDGGASWARFARLGSGNHYVLDNIVFDPAHPGTIYVAAWSVETDGGDLFRSRDGGKTWKALDAMRGKSIRGLALAASDPKLLVVGALDGVFRTRDGGESWERISPANHAEIKTIESVAIDPRNPDVIYAGTWHLAWKTSDGGRSWQSIKKGMIDDSDVFSIIVDHGNSSVVYASACSGIYRSENGGLQFHKIQGIPFSARRTRMLKQDPSNADVVYAGTTEGLWRTVDAGKTWKRISEPNRILNDVLVDPRNSSRVLLATDRSGVLVSSDYGQTFRASNRGFAHRQVAALLVDRGDRSRIYAGVINDKEFGGVFLTSDGGATWNQVSAGLGGRDVFTLAQAESGTLVAGTNNGIFALHRNQAVWRPANTIMIEKTLPRARGSKKAPQRAYVKSELRSRVAQVAITPGKWFAAAGNGLYISLDEGGSWHTTPLLAGHNFVAVQSSERSVVAATLAKVYVSTDAGSTWSAASVPTFVTTIYAATISGDGSLWLATREGALRSADRGATWERALTGLPTRNIRAISYDAEKGGLLAVSGGSGEVFESRDQGKSWRRVEAGWNVRSLVGYRGRYVAATAFDGLVAQPDGEAPRTLGGGNEGGGGQ